MKCIFALINTSRNACRFGSWGLEKEGFVLKIIFGTKILTFKHKVLLIFEP
jgi:hypothetical protein